jgi:hypothetical protein
MPKKTTTAKPARKPTRAKRDEIRDRVVSGFERARSRLAHWYITTKPILDELYRVAEHMELTVRDPETFLSKVVDRPRLRELVEGLDNARNAMGDFQLPTDVAIPDPAHFEREDAEKERREAE